MICIPWQVKSADEIRRKNFSDKLEKPYPQKEVWVPSCLTNQS